MIPNSNPFKKYHMSTFTSLSIILAGWTLISTLLCGLGAIMNTLAGLKHNKDIFHYFWFGWGGLIIGLQCWQLFLPVDWKSALIFGVLGTVGLFHLFRTQPRQKWDSALSPLVLLLLFSLPLLLWLALTSLRVPTHNDSGLYYFNMIRWLNEYPIVPGLGNLHGRLAYNQSFFLYAAFLNIFPLTLKGHHFANSLLLCMLSLEAFVCFFRVLRAPAVAPLSQLFNLLFAPVVLIVSLTSSISSPSPDIAIFVLGVLLSTRLLRYFETLPGGHEEEAHFASICLLASLAVTIKLSSLIHSVALIALLFFFWQARHKNGLFSGQFFNTARKPILLSYFCLGIWSLRGLLSSGYLLYPSSFGAFPVDWRIPREFVRFEAEWIYSWARNPQGLPEEVLASWDWLKVWWPNIFSSEVVLAPVTLFLAASVVLLLLNSIPRLRHAQDYTIYLLLLPTVLSLIFWFLTAPDPRFAASSFWVLAFLSVCMIVSILRQYISPKWIVTFALLFYLAGALLPFAFRGKVAQQLPKNGFEPLPRAVMEEFICDSGLSVWVPMQDDLAWDSDLPSTPYPDKTLHLRGDGLRSGFRKEGVDR